VAYFDTKTSSEFFEGYCLVGVCGRDVTFTEREPPDLSGVVGAERESLELRGTESDDVGSDDGVGWCAGDGSVSGGFGSFIGTGSGTFTISSGLPKSMREPLRYGVHYQHDDR
jgi:hypothetical protein